MAIFFHGKQKEDGEQAIVFQATAIQAIEIGRRRQTGGTGHLEQTDRDRVTKTDGQGYAEKNILSETNKQSQDDWDRLHEKYLRRLNDTK